MSRIIALSFALVASFLFFHLLSSKVVADNSSSSKDQWTVSVTDDSKAERQSPLEVSRSRFRISHEIVDYGGPVPRIKRKKKIKKEKKQKVKTRKPLNRRERWREEKLRMRLEFNLTATENHPTNETIPIHSEIRQPSDYGLGEAWNDDEELRKFLETRFSSEDEDKENELSSRLIMDNNSLLGDNVSWNEKGDNLNLQERLQKSSDLSDFLVNEKHHRQRSSGGAGKNKDNRRSEYNMVRDYHERPKLGEDKIDQFQNSERGNKDRIKLRDRRNNETDSWSRKREEVIPDKNVNNSRRTGKYKKNNKGGRRFLPLKKGEMKIGAQWAKHLKLDDIRGPKRVRNLMKIDDTDM